jgi:ribosome-associated translation inhibitor RaiA
MRTIIRANSLASDAVCDHARRRLEFALSRFSPRITTVWLRLTDLNGPRGGIDKQCRIEVRGRDGWSVVVDDRNGDLYAAIDRAADRAGRAVARALERVRDRAAGFTTERLAPEAA